MPIPVWLSSLLRWLRIVAPVVGVLLIAAAIWIWIYGPVPLAAPPPGDEDDLEVALSTQAAFIPPPAGSPLSWVFRLPEAQGGYGTLLIGSQPDSRLPRSGRISAPPQTLARSGIYVAVSDENGNLSYVARLSDPRTVRHERAGFSRQRGGVIAGRAPFVPNGTFRIFEVQQPQVSRVLLQLPLRSQPFVESGRRYWVPYS